MRLQLSFFYGVAAFVMLIGYASLAPASAAASSAADLNVEDFSRLPDVSMLKLSPDGGKVISLVRYQTSEKSGVLLHVLDLRNNTKKLLLSSDNQRFVVRWIEWAGNDAVLLSTFYPSSNFGIEVTATRLLRIDVNSGETNSAIPTGLLRRAKYNPSIQDNVIDHLPDSPDEILVALRLSNQVGTEVFKINHRTQRSKRVHRFRAATMSWLTDRQNRLRVARQFSDAKVSYSFRGVDSRKWQQLFKYQVFDESFQRPLGFDSDPNLLYYEALHDGRTAIFKTRLDQAPLAPQLVYSHPHYDVDGTLVYAPKAQRVVGVRHNLGDGYTFWDPEYQALQGSIDDALAGKNNYIIGFSDDERRILILSSDDVDAGTYLLWDRDIGQMNALAYRYQTLDPKLMSPKQAVRYKARDGLEIEAFLTQPINTKPNRAATAKASIIFPHGGPISADDKGFDYWTQYFASRGYNVLQMNFRGSSGYGHDFMTSGLQDWGGKMQQDVEDGTRWLIEQGIADPQKICVVGASYGGYAALMEAANNPDLYQCVVSFAGVTDLNLLLSRARHFTNHKVVKQQIGTQRKKLHSNSPVNRADRIDIPILLVQGSKDRAVPVGHGRKMHRRLKKYGKQVHYIEFEGGNHYLSNEQHRVEFFKQMDRFLATHLQ